MTDLEVLQRGTIAALREQLLQQAEKPCATCAAKDQTITLLADVVDWHRSQSHGPHAASPTLNPAPSVPFTFAAPGDLWATDEEEDIAAALESGAMDTAAAERALAFMQAQNQTLSVVK